MPTDGLREAGMQEAYSFPISTEQFSVMALTEFPQGKAACLEKMRD